MGVVDQRGRRKTSCVSRACSLVGRLVGGIADSRATGNSAVLGVRVHLVALGSFAADRRRARFMDNLESCPSTTAPWQSGRRCAFAITWPGELLYIGTFGLVHSVFYVGGGGGGAFGAVGCILVRRGGGYQSAAQGVTAPRRPKISAFVGPLLWFDTTKSKGGPIADRVGGGTVTLWASRHDRRSVVGESFRDHRHPSRGS